jgi:hypothetical protein
MDDKTNITVILIQKSCAIFPIPQLMDMYILKSWQRSTQDVKMHFRLGILEKQLEYHSTFR